MERQASISRAGTVREFQAQREFLDRPKQEPVAHKRRALHSMISLPPDAARATTTVHLVIMKRLIVYLIVFPLITVLFLITLGLARSGASHLLVVSAAALCLMLLPAVVVWTVDVLAGRTLWCVIAGFVAVPLAIDVALYSVASPRILESIYFGIAGAVAAAACRALTARKSGP